MCKQSIYFNFISFNVFSTIFMFCPHTHSYSHTHTHTHSHTYKTQSIEMLAKATKRAGFPHPETAHFKTNLDTCLNFEK